MLMRETDGWDVREITLVEYVDHMGDDDAICDAARVSFDKAASNYSADQNQGLLNYLAKHDHWTPFAHTAVKLRFRAPIFLARQFVKHQVGFVWNEVSRRYVDSNPWFFMPDAWRQRPDNMKQGSVFEGAKVLHEGENYYKNYLFRARDWSKDYKELRAANICPEQARMVMPQSMITEWIWTGSLMAWWRFVTLRLDNHAQAECWPYASSVARILEDLFPKSLEAFDKSFD